MFQFPAGAQIRPGFRLAAIPVQRHQRIVALPGHRRRGIGRAVVGAMPAALGLVLAQVRLADDGLYPLVA